MPDNLQTFRTLSITMSELWLYNSVTSKNLHKNSAAPARETWVISRKVYFRTYSDCALYSFFSSALTHPSQSDPST